MATPYALMAMLDLNEGPIEYRVFEDYLEITVGSERTELVVTLNLSTSCVVTLASVIEQAIPMLRANDALIKEGRITAMAAPPEYRVMIGDPCTTEPMLTASAEPTHVPVISPAGS
ncbi:hypothetical protein [Actinokineospora sp.]|uniref:hypothetical protein n=1 Tax=Actinokineospora sp. TaxID=1872133 RepID=UPI0040384314